MIRDVALSLIARAVTISLGVATSILTARELGVTGRGEFFYIITLAGFVVQFGHLGLASSNTYTLAKDHNTLANLAANSFWISLVSGVLATFAVLLLVAGWNELQWREIHPRVLFVLGLAMLYCLLASNLLIGLGKIRQYNFFQIGSASCQLTALGVAAWMSYGLEGFLVASAAASIISAFTLMWLLSRFHAIRWKFDLPLFFSQLGYAGRAYVVTLLGYSISRVGVFLIGHYSGKSEVGIYSVAVQFMDVLVIIPSTTAMVLFPNLMKNDNPNQYSRTLTVTGRVGLIMLVLCLLTGIAANWLIPILFGNAYAPAIHVLWWMLPGVLVLSVVTIVSQYLAAQGMPYAILWSWAGGLSFLFFSSKQMVPELGSTGAAICLSLTYIILGAALFSIAYAHHRKCINA